MQKTKLLLFLILILIILTSCTTNTSQTLKKTPPEAEEIPAKIETPKRLDLGHLSDSEIIELFLKNSGLKEKYEGWNFSIRGKTLASGKLFVDLYAYRGDWEQVNHLSFALDASGNVSELNVYPYVKTSMPEPLSKEELQKALKLALNDSEVKKKLAGGSSRYG